jgi:hypothetical protein
MRTLRVHIVSFVTVDIALLFLRPAQIILETGLIKN